MKERLDTLLVKKGLYESREKARRAIMAGVVYVENQKLDKAGTTVDIQAQIHIKESINPYVSRGGLKLEKGISEFRIDLAEKTCMDIGASTGGFTDCMLQNRAKKVFAIDVGYGQLAWKLRNDPRVICMERTNFRHVKKEQIGEEVDFASVDVSFISLKLILPVAKTILKTHGHMLCLIKPQFEAGRDKVGKKGVVRDPKVHTEVISTIIDFTLDQSFEVINITYSPIKGPEGNIEYLMYIKNVARAINEEIENNLSENKNKQKEMTKTDKQYYINQKEKEEYISETINKAFTLL